MSKLKKLVFFGNERLATSATTTAPTLRALIDAGYEIKAVIASHVDGVSRQKRDLEIGLVAHSYRIPVILPGDKIDLAAKLERHRAEAAVLVAYGKIIPQEVIDLFPKGIINIHPSLLPKLRGPTPVETAILDGLSETGVSLMKLTAQMDAGPVYAQKKIALSGRETKFELAEKLNQEGAKLLIECLGAIFDGSFEPAVQDESQATYSRLLTKDLGLVDFKQPAELIERQVRAYAGWPKSRARLHGHEVVITKARVAQSTTDGPLVMKCQPGWLEILELLAPSGRRMSGADFIRGYFKKGLKG
ncbi:MAG TPA: methionyl-tRNA formyltransferase [Candidatus Nitrosopolaris sp.]|nr:methionyl-tRNA formyltransferase [Candidatus Nitrosopolaris sp.]